MQIKRGQGPEDRKDVNWEEREFHYTLKEMNLKVDSMDMIENIMYVEENNAMD